MNITASETLYQAIFRRRSVRKYHMELLSPEVLGEIEDYLGQLQPLMAGIRVKFAFQEHGQVWDLFPSDIPYYITISSEVRDCYLCNAGFVGQQIALYLSARGLGSCWLGVAKPHEPLKSPDGTEFVIMLGFGEPAGSLHRTGIWQFRRKPLYAITSIAGAEDLLEPVRLAPSAMNRQPWYFYGTRSQVHAARTRLSPVMAPFFNKLNQIDLGIALCHLALSAEHLGKSVRFTVDNDASKPPKGYEYVITADIS